MVWQWTRTPERSGPAEPELSQAMRPPTRPSARSSPRARLGDRDVENSSGRVVVTNTWLEGRSQEAINGSGSAGIELAGDVVEE